MKAIRIRPLGPTHYGIRPLQSPGAVLRDDVWHLPPPATVLGALGRLAGIRLECPDGSPKGALEALRDLAEKLGLKALWGPLAVADDGKILYPTLEGTYPHAPLWKARRIGLALTPHKTAAPGHLYTATYSKPVEAIYFIEADRIPTGLVRVGGEGRLALIEPAQADPSPWAPPERGRAAVLAPLLLPHDEACIKKVVGVLTPRGLEKRAKIIQWGLGYSEVCNQRRPMYPALPPGAVVEIENCGPAAGHLKELGYGSLALAPREGT